MLERFILIFVLVFFAVIGLGVFLMREHSGRGGLPVFALFTLLACVAAFMAASVLTVPGAES